MARIDWDRWGTLASGLCAVHCAFVGLAMGLLPVIGLQFLALPWVDVAFFATAVFLGAWAARAGFLKHRSFTPAKIFAVGLSLVLISHFVIGHRHLDSEQAHSLAGVFLPEWIHNLSTAMAVFGGLILVTFHIVNHRLANKATCPCAVCQVDETVSGVVQTSTVN